VDSIAFHKVIENEPCLVAAHSDVVELMTKAVQQNYGMSNPIMGDKLLAVWNVKSQKADHAGHCAAAALQISVGVKKLQTAHEEYALQGVRIACTAGLWCPAFLDKPH